MVRIFQIAIASAAINTTCKTGRLQSAQTEIYQYLENSHPIGSFGVVESLRRKAAKLSASQLSHPPTAKLTTPIDPRPNDLNEVTTPIRPLQLQRQQKPPQPQPRLQHIQAVSVGISPSPPRVRFAQPQSEQQLTHDFEEELGSSTNLASSAQKSSPEEARRPHRALRRSKNTESAILYALEEALRHPNPFTPDLVEENASMADLAIGRPEASAGNVRPGRTQVPGTTGSPSIRGPRDIMRDRQARERRKQEDAERIEMERIHAEEEARLLEEDKRRSAEKRAAAVAGAAAQQQRGNGAQRGSGDTTGQRVSDASQRSGVGTGGPALGGSGIANRPRPPQQSSQTTRPPQPVENPRFKPAQPNPSAPGPSTESQTQGGAGGNSGPPRSSFPHAFERWETLSAHWEGLTSFWIRRLGENSTELSRDTISQQLSRQVTDLSAAGANLFHAVVELQRLRASSERKFQRWFFETRAEQERAQEIQAMTEASLQQERDTRAATISAAIEEALQAERHRATSDKQVAEMKRELLIAKEEAKRAWDELGRREELELAVKQSLREGLPTIVGGVQVVPMMPGVPGRQESNRATEGSARAGTQSVQEPEGPIDDSDEADQQYSRSQREPRDPFNEQTPDTTPTRAAGGRTTRAPAATSQSSYSQQYSQAPAVQPTSSSAFYNQPGTSIHPVDPTNRSEHNPSYGPSVQSSGAYSEEYQLDDQGRVVLDRAGKPIPFSPHRDEASDDDDEEDAARDRERELAYLQEYGRAPVSGVEYGRGPTSTGSMAPPTSNPASTGASAGTDYSGQGYGSAPGWEDFDRHHHPTRLSDVIEEDERSRASTSQVSRRD